MFASLTQEQLIHIVAVVALAAMPAMIWFGIIFKGRSTARWSLLLAFSLGTLTVLPLMALEYLWVFFPELNIYKAIEVNITEAHFAAFLTLIFVGMFEELAKSGVVRAIDKTKLRIQTINDAVKYSILAGLGFAFTENIFYFYYIWQSGGFVGLIFPLIFRSIFTVCAHMVFSGIFGYFYGLAKFSRPIVEADLWLGESPKSVKWAAKFLGTNEADAHRQLTLIKGLFIAMIIHTCFNFFLEFKQLIPVVLLVAAGFTYLMYLLAHKAGAIVFSGLGRQASIAQKDEDVVLELLAMWTKQGRYKDVTDICQRLLIRDPDNKVVQLFQARAMDKEKLANLETSFSALFKSEQKDATDKSMRTLVRQKVLMEMLKDAPSVVPSAVQPVAPEPAPVAPQTGPSSPPSSPSMPQIPTIPSPHAEPLPGAASSDQTKP